MTQPTRIRLPYFDALLAHIKRGDEVAQQALGEHVHWGYWDNQDAEVKDAADFRRAGEAMIRQVVRHATLRDEMRLLDVGCGFGGTIKYINETQRSCTFIGVNIDERQLAMARANVVAKNGNTISFINMNAEALDFPSESFDAILCVESIFHFQSRKHFLRDCARILAPSGRLVVSDFVPLRGTDYVLDFLERITHIVGRAYGEVHLNISVPRYRRLATQCGLVCVSTEDVTRNTLPTYGFLRNNIGRTKEGRPFIFATRLIEFASRVGLVRYQIMTFEKSGSGIHTV